MAYVEIYKDERYDYTSGKLDYEGKHTTHKAVTSDEYWQIWKYTWDGDNNVRKEGPLEGSWTDRASLDWA